MADPTDIDEKRMAKISQAVVGCFDAMEELDMYEMGVALKTLVGTYFKTLCSNKEQALGWFTAWRQDVEDEMAFVFDQEGELKQ